MTGESRHRGIPPDRPGHRPTIAVVLPVHDGEDLVTEALDSVARQSRPADEIVVVDDGSTDGTAAAVEGWALDRGAPVRLLRRPHGGVSAALNAGIEAAEADLVALLDTDDLLHPPHLETLASAFAHGEELVLAFGNARRRRLGGERGDDYFAGKPIQRLPYREGPRGFRYLEGSAYASLVGGSYIATCATLFRRSAALEAGLFDPGLEVCQDRDFWLRLSRVGRFAYTPRVVATVRYHGENLTHARHRVRSSRHAWLVTEKMAARAPELGLSGEELAATREARREAERSYLYHASRAGAAAYAAACVALLSRGRIGSVADPRHLVRAILPAPGEPDRDGAGASGDDVSRGASTPGRR